MTHIAGLFADGPTLSFEFFPPKTPAGFERLHETTEVLAGLEPTFVSMTYGAGGSTRATTRDLVIELNNRLPFPAMPHLTCVGQSKAEIRELLEAYRDAGIQNVLALAGDPPTDGSPDEGEFTYATELIELIRDVGEFTIGVAAFPEIHPRSPDRASDRRYLVEKLNLVDFAITQFFLEPHHFLRMRDELDALGVDKPLLPGVMPFINVAGLRRMADMNRSHIPDELQRRLDAVDGDAEATRLLGVEHAAAQIEVLRSEGVAGLHLYSMNRPDSIEALDDRVGLHQHV
ncbi:MAG TPA: methylenetetrahydrofolate reductase [Acidimicrobiales bacterium]|nr:methylenetetrahydrofolate reductase [Acidimicrobiales bacterium]